MAPIRVGFIGLSSKKQDAYLGPGSWGALAHLPYLLSSPDYNIVALANSSEEAARKAIKAYNLPVTTKAYGSGEEIAKDPDVDLIVISVVVMKHYELVKPALLAKKQVFVEWPLGATLDESKELAALAKENGVRTIVGAQARADPLVAKVKEILGSGQIGGVRSSSVLGCFSSIYAMDVWFEGAEYYLDMKSGGNSFMITFGHFFDSFTDVLGEFVEPQATLKTFKNKIPIVGADGQIKLSEHPKNTPDHILVQGVLKQSGAVASICYRSGKSTVDGVAIRWLITGTKGEIEVTVPEVYWQMSDPGRKLRLRIGTDEAIDVPFANYEDKTGLERLSINVGGLYDAFLRDDQSRYATFGSALETHELLDKILKNSGSNT
ncbi:oxidoreductase, putative [Talaromyces stipitatus ATCC 10500]|uniref:Oxidoreductase, putative n=1 Tax=Talaromyces stipitatus (strain ATCC 10500 / CBS 375.48 / QM 6759 / NRRL 1006) TaxID=441959 RepID=B8MFG0_TALSN|nr:oxidoreductase, putative [Talaromyces stipitatus ATCC 10500]EED16694.1 oxidoreductase, putative [Talaromyces stipitatus ATCC 10500]